MTDPALKKCEGCNGRGYHRCQCWPGDCICGDDARDCEECGGDGWIDPSYDDWQPAPPSNKEGGEA